MTTSTRILVTGGNGFLGSHLVERLLEVSRPHVVIHLAAKVGGIGANRLHPGSFFRDNALMGMQLIEARRTHPAAKDLRKFVQLGTVCAYPSSRRSPSAKTTSGTATPRRPTPPRGSPPPPSATKPPTPSTSAPAKRSP